LGVSLSIPLAIVASGSQKTRIAKTSIAKSSIAKISISIGSGVRVTRISKAIARVSGVSSVGGSQVLGVSLSISIPLTIVTSGSKITKTRIAKTSIAKSSIATVSISIAKTIAESITRVSSVSGVGGSEVLGVSLGLSISLSLAIVSSLGHRVKSLGDGVQSRAGSKGDGSMRVAIASIAKTSRVASIAKSTIAIASIGITSIAKLSLS